MNPDANLERIREPYQDHVRALMDRGLLNDEIIAELALIGLDKEQAQRLIQDCG